MNTLVEGKMKSKWRGEGDMDYKKNMVRLWFRMVLVYVRIGAVGVGLGILLGILWGAK